MAPPPPPKQASRVARPAARYRPGKAPLGAGVDDYSDSDESDGAHGHAEDHASQHVDVGDMHSATAALLHGQQRNSAGIVIHETARPSSSRKLDLRLQPAAPKGELDAQDDSSEYETDTDQEQEDKAALAKPVFRKPGTAAPPLPAPTASSSSSEYETDSEDEESGQEEESAPPTLIKPIFKPKSARTTLPTDTADSDQNPIDAEAKAEQEVALRRKEAHDLAAATIQRQLAEKQHAATHQTEVDDTDGLDPEAEFQAWRQRELARLERDRNAMLAAQKERDEIEQFKSLPEAEKERLGRERAERLRAEKREQRGNPAFMQKYYHKGSFFQDMDILKRDYSEKTTREVDVSKLPKMMQVRNYGAKGRSKWTHLANEDTSKGAMRLDVERSAAGGGEARCFACGGPHLKKDCPEREGRSGTAGGSATGANEGQLASGSSRKWGATEGERRSDKHRGVQRRSRSPSPSPRSRSRRDPTSDADRYDTRNGSSSHGSRTRHGDDKPRHRHRQSSTRSSPDDQHEQHSRPSSSRNHREPRNPRDNKEEQDRHHSHRHRNRNRSPHHTHRSHHHDDAEHDRHKRRHRTDHHHHSSRSSRDGETDRKRSRLDA